MDTFPCITAVPQCCCGRAQQSALFIHSSRFSSTPPDRAPRVTAVSEWAVAPQNPRRRPRPAIHPPSCHRSRSR
eukprot:6302854-Prymnesium_polylepis.1